MASAGQEQLADPVARDISAQVEKMELDAPALQSLDDLERVEGRAEQAIQLGRDGNVAPLKLGERRATDRTLLDGNGPDTHPPR
jgi:hypothetical protein